MKKVVIWIALLILVVLIASTALAQVSGGGSVSWQLLSAGGGQRRSIHYQIDDTLGQLAVGQSVGDRYQIDSGFWSAGRMPERWRLFMPVAVGNDQPNASQQPIERIAAYQRPRHYPRRPGD